MNDRSTDELNEILGNTQPDQLDQYLRDNKKYMACGPKAFYYYFKDRLDEKRIRLKDVYVAADVSETYGGKIVTMERHSRNRDLIIRLCLGGHFSWIEIDRALKLYGMAGLYAKDPRDACIIVAVNNRIFDPYQIDKILAEQGLKKITDG